MERTVEGKEKGKYSVGRRDERTVLRRKGRRTTVTDSYIAWEELPNFSGLHLFSIM